MLAAKVAVPITYEAGGDARGEEGLGNRQEIPHPPIQLVDDRAAQPGAGSAGDSVQIFRRVPLKMGAPTIASGCDGSTSVKRGDAISDTSNVGDRHEACVEPCCQRLAVSKPTHVHKVIEGGPSVPEREGPVRTTHEAFDAQIYRRREPPVEVYLPAGHERTPAAGGIVKEAQVHGLLQLISVGLGEEDDGGVRLPDVDSPASRAEEVAVSKLLDQSPKVVWIRGGPEVRHRLHPAPCRRTCTVPPALHAGTVRPYDSGANGHPKAARPRYT